MRLQTKLFTGTTLSLVLSAIAIAPAMAQTGTMNQQMQMNTTNQMMMSPSMMQTGMMRGTVVGTSGDIVRVRYENGMTQDFIVSSADLQRLSLTPGMTIVTDMRNDGSVVFGMGTATGNAAFTPGATTIVGQSVMRATVRSVVGDLVTLQWPDGTVRDYTFMRADIDRLNILPGSDVIVSMRDNRIAGIDLARDFDQRLGTLGTQTTIVEQTTVTPQQPIVQQQPIQQQPIVQQQQPIQQQPVVQQQQPTGVRALW